MNKIWIFLLSMILLCSSAYSFNEYEPLNGLFPNLDDGCSAVGDFDHDGYMDIIYSGRNDDSVGSNFTEYFRYLTYEENFDSYGVPNYRTNFITEDFGGGVNVSIKQVYHPSFQETYTNCFMQVIDFNNDFFDDLVIVGSRRELGSGTPDDGIALYINDKFGNLNLFNFWDDTDLPIDLPYERAIVDDFNNDGYQDILVDEYLYFANINGFVDDNGGDTGIVVQLGKDFGAGDFDGDGDLDIIHDDDIYENDGSVPFPLAKTITQIQGGNTILVMQDVDDDGADNILVSYVNGVNRYTKYLNVSGNFTVDQMWSVGTGFTDGNIDLYYNDQGNFEGLIFGELNGTAYDSIVYEIEFNHTAPIQFKVQDDFVGAFRTVNANYMKFFDADNDDDLDLLVFMTTATNLVNDLRLFNNLENSPLTIGSNSELSITANIVNIDDPDSGLLPEIGNGLVSFFNGIGVNTFVLMMLFVFVIVFIMILKILIGSITKVVGK